MNVVLDKLEWARRLPRRLRRIAVRSGAIAIAVVAACAIAVPAFAHDGTKPSPTPCSTTAPITLPCAATVNPPASAGAPYTITLPGIGTLNVTVDANGKITGATVSDLAPGVTASTPTVDSDGDKVSVTFTTAAGQIVKLTVKAKPPTTAGGSPTVTAKASDRHRHHDHEEDADGDHHGDGSNWR